MNTFSISKVSEAQRIASSSKELGELISAMEEAEAGKLICVRGEELNGDDIIYGIYTMTEDEYSSYLQSGGTWKYITYDEFIS